MTDHSDFHSVVLISAVAIFDFMKKMLKRPHSTCHTLSTCLVQAMRSIRSTTHRTMQSDSTIAEVPPFWTNHLSRILKHLAPLLPKICEVTQEPGRTRAGEVATFARFVNKTLSQNIGKSHTFILLVDIDVVRILSRRPKPDSEIEYLMHHYSKGVNVRFVSEMSYLVGTTFRRKIGNTSIPRGRMTRGQSKVAKDHIGQA